MATPQDNLGNGADKQTPSMEQFFATHGIDALDTDEGIGDRKADVKPKPTSVKSSEPEQGRQRKEGQEPETTSELDLDRETLQKLGLVEPDASDPQSQPAAEGEGEEGDTTQPQLDLGAISQHLGVDQKDLAIEDGVLKVRTNVNGDIALTPFSELRAGYQLRAHLTRQNEQFLRQKQEWEQAQAQQVQQFQQQSQLAAGVLQEEAKALDKQYTRNWNQLRQEDPAEYAAQVAEYNQRKADIQQRQQTLTQNYQQVMMQQAQERQQKMTQMRDAGAQVLAHQMGWDTPEKFEKGAGELKNYLLNEAQLHPHLVTNIIDPRLLHTLSKAQKYDALMQKVDLSKKRVREAGKMPSGSAQQPPGSRNRKVAQAIKQVRQDNSLDSAARAFEEMGILAD